MKTKHLVLACGFVFLPLLAQAQTQTTPGGESLLANLLEMIVPFLLIGGLFWFFFIRRVGAAQRRSQEYMSEMKVHNARVEELLERIAKTLERKDDGGTRQP